jgi:fumarate reductase flavoprotein subunit
MKYFFLPRLGKAAVCSLVLGAAFIAGSFIAGCGSLSSGPAGSGDGPGRQTAGFYRPGTYTGYGIGQRGEIAVSVEVDSRNIVSIEIIRTREDPFVGRPAMEALSDTVLEENTTGIDIVSGATMSSLGFLEAMEDALSKAMRERPDDL